MIQIRSSFDVYQGKEDIIWESITVYETKTEFKL